MKIISKLFSLLMLLLITIIFVVLLANSGKLNYLSQKTFEKFLASKNLDVTFKEFELKNKTITAKKLLYKNNSANIEVKNFKLKFDLQWNNAHPKLYIDIAKGNAALFDKKEKNIGKAEYYGSYNKIIGAQKYNCLFFLDNLNFKNQDHLQNQQGSFKFNLKYSKEVKFLDLKFTLGNNSLLQAYNTSDNKIKIIANNTSLLLYKLPHQIFPQQGVLVFLNDFIKDGEIQNLDLLIDPNKPSTSTEFMSGSGVVKDCELEYNSDLPSIKNMNIKIKIVGPDLNFYVDEAYSTDIKLYDGHVHLNCSDMQKAIVKINVKGKGPAFALTDFIAAQHKEKLKIAKLDITKIKGLADINVKIDIPLAPGTITNYDISANIPNTRLNILSGNIILTKADVNGKYDGNHVYLQADGLINGFKSDITFIQNLTDDAEFNHKLNIKSKIIKTKNNKKIAFVNMLKGKADVDFEYINKNDIGYIDINSDLTNLDLFFEKLGIRKKKGKFAELNIRGEFKDIDTGKYKFRLKGDDKLDIKGGAYSKQDKTIFDIQTLRNKKTNLKAKFIMSSSFFDAKINGDILDLSNSNTLNLLEKEQDAGAVNLSIKANKIILKKNISLNKVNLSLKCKNSKCYYGRAIAKINQKNFDLALVDHKAYEEWAIRCGDAGALLKGLDIYDSMKGGSLTLNITTNRKEISPGDILPIHNGMFTFEDFKLTDNSAALKFVSLVSLPGLFSALSGKKNISFDSMKGKFNFQSDLLYITNTIGKGPYFNFFISGNINTKQRYINLKGHVTPKLYGASTVAKSVPVLGELFRGDKKRQGLMSKSFKIKETY